MLRRWITATCAAATLTAAAQAQKIPPAAECKLSTPGFAGWFADHKAGKDGLVTFADSVGFPTQSSACDFYKWAHRMFLWTMSPVQGALVLDSPVFFNVAFSSTGGTYIPNGSNRFALRGAKPQSIQSGGQAGGNDTLMALNGSLVYFGVNANDVYAWFNTAVTNGAIPVGTPFPSSQAELDPIVAYAKLKGVDLPDAKALTMEIKSAWVDFATLADKSEYITMPAVVPNYKRVSPTNWVIDAQIPTVPKTLALVGIHVVGPVKGHPEMVWSTFEHKRNAPDNAYYVSGKRQPVPFNSKGKWTFMADAGTQAGALVAQMTVSSADGSITATPGNTIRANNVYRVMPWGNDGSTSASAANNSRLISLNGDIRRMLGALGDVRANYFQVGAVWTRDGSVPANPGDTSKQAGSLRLGNATMETYHQANTPGCFGCHNATSSIGTSHMFSVSNTPLVAK